MYLNSEVSTRVRVFRRTSLDANNAYYWDPTTVRACSYIIFGKRLIVCRATGGKKLQVTHTVSHLFPEAGRGTIDVPCDQAAAPSRSSFAASSSNFSLIR